MAGTAVPFRDLVIVVAPKARAVFGIDTADGRIRWKRPTDFFSRGAVTVVDSLVITSDAGSHLRVLRATDGGQICAATLPEPTDRSGPTIAGQTALFAGLRGLVYARPVRDVLRCEIAP